MTRRHQIAAISVIDLVVKDYFRRESGVVDDVDARMHAVDQRLVIMELQVNEWGIVALFCYPQVFQMVFPAELLAGILKVERVGTMPHHLHRVDLAEAYIEGFTGS